jgi:hypothetical protein
LTAFLTKLTEFVPFIFIISQYCPTVVWSEYYPTGFVCPTNWGGCRPPRRPPPRPVRPCSSGLGKIKWSEEIKRKFCHENFMFKLPLKLPDNARVKWRAYSQSNCLFLSRQNLFCKKHL